eukprot:686922-Hanusia_phi.AAC.1
MCDAEQARDREEASKRLRESEEQQSSWARQVEELEEKLDALLGRSSTLGDAGGNLPQAPDRVEEETVEE